MVIPFSQIEKEYSKYSKNIFYEENVLYRYKLFITIQERNW